MQSNTSSLCKKIFEEACRTGDTTHLANLIDEGNFEVNESLSKSRNIFPLLFAVDRQCMTVVNLLLEKGADPNKSDGMSLKRAVLKQNLKMVELLLKKGADPNPSERLKSLLLIALTQANPTTEMIRLLLDAGADSDIQSDKVISAAVLTEQEYIVGLVLERVSDLTKNMIIAIATAISSYRDKPGTRVILELLLDRALQQIDNPEVDEKTKKLGQYSQLGKAILKDDEDKVYNILKIGDYESYAAFFRIDLPRVCFLALSFVKPNMLKPFIHAGIDLERIFVESASNGYIELVELCAQRAGFDPHVQVGFGGTALHRACSHDQLEVAKVLVSKYGLKLDQSGPDADPPFSLVSKARMLRDLLEAFPETDVNARSIDGYSMLADCPAPCARYSTMLEFGADPLLGNDNFHSFNDFDGEYDEDECDFYTCDVIHYLQKMMIIDMEYVDSILYAVLNIDINLYEFKLLKSPNEEKYLIEMAKMQGVKISQGTSTMAGKSLLDFMYFGANEAARYSRNEIVLNIYETHQQNFENYLPHYGFALNRILRRGKIRYDRMEAALDIIYSALGTLHVPEDLAELVFGYFSNRSLQQFLK